MLYDLELIASRHAELLHDAYNERLAALVPQRGSNMRRDLAVACHRLADWLDGSDRYVRRSEAGPGYWVPRSARL